MKARKMQLNYPILYERTNMQILDKAKSYEPGSRQKHAMSSREMPHSLLNFNLLNSRNELVTKCRHENKFHLSNYKDIPS